MIKVWWRYVKTTTKDVGSLISLVVSPIVLILILGSALGGDMTVSSFDVMVLTDGDAEDFVEVKQVLEAANIRVDDLGDTPLEEGLKYASGILRYEEALILIKSDYRLVSAGIVEQVLNEYLTMNEAYNVLGNIEHRGIEENMVLNTQNWHAIAPSAMEYYAVTMLAMVVAFSLAYGTSMMSYELKDYRGLRLRSAPIKHWKIYIGISLSVVVCMLIQGFVIVFFTKFVYGVRWTNDYILLTLMIAGFSFVGSNVGMIIAGIVNDDIKSSNLVNITVPVMTALSGGYFKLSPDSEMFVSIQKLIPNYRFQEMAFASSFTGATEPISSGFVYLLVAIVLSIIGLMYQVRQVAK